MRNSTRLAWALAVAAALTACSREKTGLEIEPGSEVTVERKDGVRVTGRLVEVKPEQIVIEHPDSTRTSVPRADVAALAARPAPVGETPSGAAAGSTVSAQPRSERAAAPTARPVGEVDPAHGPREVTIPAGTVLPVELSTAVSSETSRLEDPVRGTLRQPVTVGGRQVLPAGTVLLGHVTAAERSARVKGRARVAFRFTSLDLPGDTERVSIRTEGVSRLAEATKKQDAAKIGGGAAGGAIVGGILGGGDGAAKGAAIGGAAGTGVVLSTRGKEVRLGPGARVAVRLSAPLTVRVGRGGSPP